jgi:hypothetical protein
LRGRVSGAQRRWKAVPSNALLGPIQLTRFDKRDLIAVTIEAGVVSNERDAVDARNTCVQQVCTAEEAELVV